MSDLDVLLNRVSPKCFLQAVDWEDTRQGSRGTEKHTLAFVSYLLLLIGEFIENVHFLFANCHLFNYLT